MPLLDNEQREAIGTRYKEQGEEAAIALGWQLGTDEVQAERQAIWREFIEQHPEGYLYCFRGGLRSRLSQQLMAAAELPYPLVEGGYKALRRFLIDELESNVQTAPITLISGRTGCGKTRALYELDHTVDLEGLANHRGSAFGGRLATQPPQISFENAISIDLMKEMDQGVKHIYLEDEGTLVGRRYLPECLKAAMSEAPLAVLESSVEERVDFALEDYVTEELPEYERAFGLETGQIRFREQILGNLHRIRKRLGGKRYQQLHQQF